MSEEIIAHMRDRIERMRKVIRLAHDPRMIELIEQMIQEAEADIAKMEAEQTQHQEQQLPPSAQP
jgi:hypothetical protein